MRKAMRRPGTALLRLFLTVGVVSACIGSPNISVATSIVTITGTILPMEREHGLNDYVLRYRDQEWVFNITDVDALDVNNGIGGLASGWSILNLIGRQRITLIGGNEQVIKALRQPDMLCKGLRIRGKLYVTNGTMVLASVENAPQQNRPEKCD